MKYFYYSVLALVVCVFIDDQASSQITITKNDIDANVLNTTRKSYGFNDTASVDLGTASSSPQSLDFSNLSTGSASSRDTSVISFVASTGQWMADQFPGANACGEISLVQVFPPITLTVSVYLYYSTENDGVYFFGGAYRQQISPPFPPFPTDTTSFAFNRPKGLQLPLPLTLGSNRSVTDSLIDIDNSVTVSSRTFDANGYGSMKLPDGRTVQMIRLVVDDIKVKYKHGTFDSRTHNRSVTFYTSDYTSMTFHVDTTFGPGSALAKSSSTLVNGYEFQTLATPLGVSEVSNGIPASFTLSQNYPNPFNPSTVISFQLPVASHATLKVYNVMGQEVATLVDQQLSAGSYQATLNASKLGSGVYVYRLSAGSFSKSMRLVVVK